MSTKDKKQNTKAALTKKKAAGVQLNTPSKGVEVSAQVRQLRASGASKPAIARALQLAASTVAKYVLAASTEGLVTRLGQKLRAVR